MAGRPCLILMVSDNMQVARLHGAEYVAAQVAKSL